MMAGWITLSRGIVEHWVYEGERFDHTHAWIDLLMLANFADKKKVYKGELITCKRGDVNYSMKYLAERWGWSWRAVKHFLDILASDGMITMSVTTNRTVITIVNYEKYQFQNSEHHNEDQSDDQNEHHNEDQNNGHNESQINKKDNKEKEREKGEKREIKNTYGEYRNVKLTQTEYDKLFDEYGPSETEQAITFLDEYIEMKGYKAKSHYLALRKWVFNAVKEQKTRQQPQKNVFDDWANA